MKSYLLRIGLALALIAGLVLLANGGIARAGDTSRPAYQDGLATLSGFVWNDADQDGLQDRDERGLPNVTVSLYDPAGALVNAVITDETGRYTFDALAPGDYYIEVEAPAGYLISPGNQGADEALDSDVDSISGRTTAASLQPGQNTLMWDSGLYRMDAVAAARPGTVRPPPAELVACESGVHSVGGVSTLEVTDLAEGYCIAAFLREHAFAVGRIPKDAGQVLAPITFVRVFYFSRLVYKLPEEDGLMKVCYALPPGHSGKIYFLDFYGPQFGERKGQPTWEPLETTIGGGVACAPAQTTGAYALIGQ